MAEAPRSRRLTTSRLALPIMPTVAEGVRSPFVKMVLPAPATAGTDFPIASLLLIKLQVVEQVQELVGHLQRLHKAVAGVLASLHP